MYDQSDQSALTFRLDTDEYLEISYYFPRVPTFHGGFSNPNTIN